MFYLYGHWMYVSHIALSGYGTFCVCLCFSGMIFFYYMFFFIFG